MNGLLERAGADVDILEAYAREFKIGGGAVALVAERFGPLPTPQEDLPDCFGALDLPSKEVVLGWSSFVSTPPNSAV